MSTPTRRLHPDAIPQQASAGRFPTGWRQMVAFLAPPAAHLRRPRGARCASRRGVREPQQTGRAARAPRCRTRGRARPHPPSHAQLGASRSKHTGGCARQLGLDSFFLLSGSPLLYIILTDTCEKRRRWTPTVPETAVRARGARTAERQGERWRPRGTGRQGGTVVSPRRLSPASVPIRRVSLLTGWRLWFTSLNITTGYEELRPLAESAGEALPFSSLHGTQAVETSRDRASENRRMFCPR